MIVLVFTTIAYRYYFIFEVINELSHTVNLQWNVQNSTGKILKLQEDDSHLKEFILPPKDQQIYSLDFSTKFDLSSNELRNIIHFTALDSRNNNTVLVNKTTLFYVNMDHGIEQPVLLIVGVTGRGNQVNSKF